MMKSMFRSFLRGDMVDDFIPQSGDDQRNPLYSAKSIPLNEIRSLRHDLEMKLTTLG
jgi:hypothetical protein